MHDLCGKKKPLHGRIFFRNQKKNLNEVSLPNLSMNHTDNRVFLELKDLKQFFNMNSSHLDSICAKCLQIFRERKQNHIESKEIYEIKKWEFSLGTLII